MLFPCSRDRGHEEKGLDPSDPEPCYAVESSRSARLWDAWANREYDRQVNPEVEIQQTIRCPKCQQPAMKVRGEQGQCENCGETAEFQREPAAFASHPDNEPTPEPTNALGDGCFGEHYPSMNPGCAEGPNPSVLDPEPTAERDDSDIQQAAQSYLEHPEDFPHVVSEREFPTEGFVEVRTDDASLLDNVGDPLTIPFDPQPGDHIPTPQEVADSIDRANGVEPRPYVPLDDGCPPAGHLPQINLNCETRQKVQRDFGLGATDKDALLAMAESVGITPAPGETDESVLARYEGFVTEQTEHLRTRPEDQVLPSGDESIPDDQSLVIEDMAERRRLGVSRYGQGHRPFNGRNTLLDAYEESLDGAVYLRSLLRARATTQGELFEHLAHALRTFDDGTRIWAELSPERLATMLADRVTDYVTLKIDEARTAIEEAEKAKTPARQQVTDALRKAMRSGPHKMDEEGSWISTTYVLSVLDEIANATPKETP